jgi:hypothetical protein
MQKWNKVSEIMAKETLYINENKSCPFYKSLTAKFNGNGRYKIGKEL